jgi:hypothetical protein
MAGLFYLVTIVAGVFAELFVRGAVMVSEDAAKTAANILAHETLYRSGLVADLVMLAAYIMVTALLYVLLKPAGAVLSLSAAFFSMIGIAVLAVGCLTHVIPLLLLRGHSLAGWSVEQLQALALVSLRLHGRAYSISTVFFGTYCVLIGLLVFRSRFMPRFAGVLMAIGGASYIISSFLSFLFPAANAALPDITLLGLVGELALTLWLLIVGVNVVQWEACANRGAGQ